MGDEPTTASKLGRQPKPNPPPYITVPAPSIWLYFFLLLVSAALLVFAQVNEQDNWTSFLLNISTEIIGAVIILILVDRRIRVSEIRQIKNIPGNTAHFALGILMPELHVAKGYVTSLITQLDSVSLGTYISRPQFEASLLSKSSNGVLVTSPAGMGKTTILHLLARSQSELVMQKPRSSRIPILVSISQWGTDDSKEILYWTMHSYYPISQRLFDRLLKKGRFICIFDGLDESVDPLSIVNKITAFRTNYPSNSVVVSCRSQLQNIFGDLNLHILTLPPFSHEEMQRVYDLRRRSEDNVT